MALALALMLVTVLSITVTTACVVTSGSARGAVRSSADEMAHSLAEAAVAEAMAILRYPSNNALDPTVFCTVSGQATPCKTTIPACPAAAGRCYSGGSASWSGVLDTASGTWAITATGTVANPTGPQGEPIVRRIRFRVEVHPTLTQPLNTPVWDYIYATKPPSTPASVCDMTLQQSVVIASPLYVAGNLCLNNSSVITRGPLVVGGRLTLSSQQQNWVGAAVKPISDAHVGNGCTLKTTTHVPCRGPEDNLYASVLDAAPPTTLTPPTVDWNRWYLNASPGPFFPCQTVDGRAPIAGYPVFDTGVPAMTADDATKLQAKNDSQGIQNLTPSWSYRCETVSGELSWDVAARKLTIRGTVFVDGSLSVQNGAVNEYDGQGSLYLSGTFLMKNSSLCGKVFAGVCDTLNPPTASRGWDPNKELLAIVANGTGGQVSPGSGIQLTGAALQGAAYATGAVELDTTSTVNGPMVGSTIILGQSVSTTFPTINTVPDGMPSNPVAYAQPDPPSDFVG